MRKDPKYKNVGEVGLDKAQAKKNRDQNRGQDWISEVADPPTKKIRMIVAENELPSKSSSSKHVSDNSSKKPSLKNKTKVTNKSNDKVTKPSAKLNKSRPRSKSRKESSDNRPRPSKSDRPEKVSKTLSNDKNEEKSVSQKSVSEVQNSQPATDNISATLSPTKRLSKIEEFRLLLQEHNLNAERERVRPEPTPVQPMSENTVQQKSVLDELGSVSSSQESNSSEVEIAPELEPQACELCKFVANGFCSSCSSAYSSEADEKPEIPQKPIVRMEVMDEEPNEIIEIMDDDEVPCPPCPPPPFEDDEDVIFVCETAPQKSVPNIPEYHDESTGQTFYYGQDLDDF